MNKFFEDYPEFNGYSAPPFLVRLQTVEAVPNTRLTRALLEAVLKRYNATPATAPGAGGGLLATDPKNPNWKPYKSPIFLMKRQAFGRLWKMPKLKKQIGH